MLARPLITSFQKKFVNGIMVKQPVFLRVTTFILGSGDYEGLKSSEIKEKDPAWNIWDHGCVSNSMIHLLRSEDSKLPGRRVSRRNGSQSGRGHQKGYYDFVIFSKQIIYGIFYPGSRIPSTIQGRRNKYSRCPHCCSWPFQSCLDLSLDQFPIESWYWFIILCHDKRLKCHTGTHFNVEPGSVCDSLYSSNHHF